MTMHPAVAGLIALLGISGFVGAILLTRHDRAGTGFLLGAVLGPLGVIIILLRRKAWRGRWHRDAQRDEEARKEQAFRDWRGY